MSVNNLNTVGNVPVVNPINLEAEGQSVTQEAAETEQKSTGSKPSAASHAVQVALESFISTELDELAQKIAARTTLVNKLPSELKELVQKILSQTQAAQTALPEGLAALLKSPKTAGEKLALLAAMLEETAEVATKPGEAVGGKATGKSELPAELLKAWRDTSPTELTATAKALRELAAALSKDGNPVAERQDLSKVKNGSETVAARQPDTSAQAPQPGRVVVPQQDAPAATSLPGKIAAGKQDSPAVLPQSDGLNSELQDAPVLATQGGEDPDAPDSFLSNRGNHSEEKTANANKPSSVAVETKNPASLVLATDTQQDNTVVKQQSASNVAVQPDNNAIEQTMLTKMLASRPELMKNLPAEIKEVIHIVLRQAGSTEPVTSNFQEPLAWLIKSSQTAADKFTMLATILEEAAELIKPEEKFAMQTAVGREQVLAEAVNAWRNKNQDEVKAAAKVIRELAETMPKPGGVLVERQTSHSVLTFSVPLYFGDGHTAYPAHIHVYYQEEEDKKNPGQQVTETWLRICLETENIGIVETAFRLYDGQSLDVKVRFDDSNAAGSFADSVQEVKEQLSQLPLTLGEFLVK